MQINLKAVFFTLVLLVAIGCKGGRSLDGKWNVATPVGVPAGAAMTAEFSGGSALKLTIDMDQPMPDGKSAKIHGDITCTYKLNGENLEIQANDVKFSVSGVPDALKGLVESQIKSQNEQVKKQINEQQGNAKLTWVDDNSFTLSGKDGKPQTFTRAK